MRFLCKIRFVRLVWVVIPLILIGFIGIQESFAACAPISFGESMPCFDSFHVSHEPFTEELIMDTIYRNLDTNYEGWIQTNRNWTNNDEGYEHPTIICTAFDWKGQTYYRMLQWKDDYRISSLEDYRNDSMCDKWFPPMSLDAANPGFDCKEAVKNEIPTDWKYNCYDEPMGNPIRDISLSNSDDPQRLQFILEHCTKHGSLDYVGELRYLNDTHLIDLDTCHWDTRTNSGISLDRTIYPISPLKQFKSGIAVDEIQCKVSLIQVVKYDGSPACVTSETYLKLFERGWITVSPDFETQREIAKQIYLSIPKSDDSPYLGITLGDDRKSLLFGIDITKLTIKKNQEYYEKLFEELFSEITIPYEIRFQENLGSDE